MSLLKEAGVADMPVGIDLAETAMFFELQKAGMKVVDGQQVMLDAREIKNIDEIVLLNQAAAMVDAAYHLIWEELKPGVRENDIVARANELLYRLGSDDVEAINAISGERCNPHPHNFTDRLLRPGDQAFFDILQSYHGLPHLLLPHLQCRPRDAGAARRLQAVPRVAGRGDRADQARRLDRHGRLGLAEGRGVRLPERDGGLRPAVRPRPRPRPARAADHLAPRLARASDGDQDRHGVRAGDLLPGQATATPRRASRRRWWSPTRAAGSSPSSPPKNCPSQTDTERRLIRRTRRSIEGAF